MAKAKVLPNIVVKINAMKAFVESAEKDGAKFDEGNNAAGARVRKAMQEIKGVCKEIRDAVTEVKEARKE
jgi:hypothetical protein